jgi:DNA-binding transcriptional ArsR family regulator
LKRALFTPAYPDTRLRIEQSKGINIMTNIQLVDYFMNSSSEKSVWLKEFSSKLNERVKEDLTLFRTVFAHGVILRQFYINEHGPLNESWDQFINWWKQLSNEKVEELIIYGVIETLDYYYTYLPPMAGVEKTMEQVSLNAEQLKNPSKRKQALRAALQSWSVDNVEEILPVYEDTKFIKQKLIHLLEGFWQSGFHKHWDRISRAFSDWQTENTPRLFTSYPTNAEAIYRITGFYPDTNEWNKVNRAKEILFIPVSNLGRLLVLYPSSGRLFVMFEPDFDQRNVQPNERKKEQTEFYKLFEGIGDRIRVQIIELIAENKEMFANQIVNQLELKQSTVSRHLNQLHQAGIVNIRQEGNTKYFSINKDALKHISDFLNSIINS